MNKPKLNKPDVETTITTLSNDEIFESLNINITKPTKLFRDIFVSDLTVEKPQLTEQQILKKFEDLGYKKYNTFHRDYIELRNEEKGERICIDLDIKTYMKMGTDNLIIPVEITLQEHQLLH